MAFIKSSALAAAKNIQQTHEFDLRFVIFEYSFDETASKLFFKVSSNHIKEIIFSFFKSKKHRYKVVVEVLNGKGFGKKNIGIGNVSAAPIMKEPSDRSEQVSQLLLGETCDLLEAGPNGWIRVRLHIDNYVGWVSQNQVVNVDRKDVLQRNKFTHVTPKSLVITLLARPKNNAAPVREFLFGTTLPIVKKVNGWCALRMPDKTIGWTRQAEIRPAQHISGLIKVNDVVATAQRMLGISYLWGGRSVKGFDCSGFIQTVFHHHGIELPRDASLQWQCGTSIGTRYSDVKKGDLLFFQNSQKRITHVALSIGGKKYIHASGMVKISSMDPKSSLFIKKYRSEFAGARRIS